MVVTTLGWRYRKPVCFAALVFGLIAGGQVIASEPLRRPIDAEPETLDPQKTTEAEGIAIDRDLFIGLATLDAKSAVVPGVASSWDVTPDKTVWTFHLRPEAKWSNGDPLTAEDFVYTFRRLVDPKTAAADPNDLKQVVNAVEIITGKEKDFSKLGVEALDAHTLKVTLNQSRVAFPFILTDPQIFPVHRATVEKWGDDWTRPEHIVSNGGYTMRSWTPQSDIVLEKNPNFYDAASVKIDEVHWINAADLDAAVRRYRAGEFDYVKLTGQTLPWAKENDAAELKAAPTNVITFMFFNMTNTPLGKDVRLREALNLAVDRDVIVKHLDPRNQVPAYGITPPSVTNYTPQNMPFMGMPMPERIAKAKELLKEAGYGPDNPLHITVSYPTFERWRQVLTGIRQMWQPLGVDLKLDNMEWQVFENLVKQHNEQMGAMAGDGSYDDYESGLDNYRSDAADFNWCAYSNVTFDDLFRRGGTATDVATRRQLMEQAERTILDDYAIIPLEYGVQNVLVSRKLQGFEPSVLYNQSRYLWFGQ